MGTQYLLRALRSSREAFARSRRWRWMRSCRRPCRGPASHPHSTPPAGEPSVVDTDALSMVPPECLYIMATAPLLSGTKPRPPSSFTEMFRCMTPYFTLHRGTAKVLDLFDQLVESGAAEAIKQTLRCATCSSSISCARPARACSSITSSSTANIGCSPSNGCSTACRNL